MPHIGLTLATQAGGVDLTPLQNLVLGLLAVAGVLLGRLRLLALLFVVAAGVHAFYAVALVDAAFGDVRVSWGGGLLYLAVTVTCLGLALSCADAYGQHRS